VENNQLVIIINIEVKYFVQNVLNSIGNGKKNLNERKLNNNQYRRITFISNRYLQAFQKVRDCSQIHQHEATPSRIQV
jgi:hypothetical protein